MTSTSGIRSRLDVDRSIYIFVVVIVIGFFVLEYYAKYVWFFGDEFAFLARTRLQDAPDSRSLIHSLLVPHNEHISIIPRLWYWLASSIWGLTTYRPYVTAAIVVHLFVVTMAWLLMRRVGVERWIAVGAAAVLTVFGPGGENILWGFQVSFMGAAGFGLAAILLASNSKSTLWRDGATTAVALLALGCAGVAVPLLLGVAIVLVIRRGVKVAILICGTPMILYAAWMQLYPANPSIPHADVSAIYFYAVAQVSKSLEAIIGVPGVGGVALLGLLAFAGWLWRSSLRDERRAPLLALLIVSASFALLTGFGRASLGIDQSGAGRYLYLQAVFLVPVLALALTRIPKSGNLRRPLAWIFLTIAIASAFLSLRDCVRDRSILVLPIRDQILAASVDRVIMSSMAPGVVVNSQFIPDLNIGALRALRENGDLPDWKPSATYRDDLRRLLAVSLGDAPPGGWLPADKVSVTRQVGVSVTSEDKGCVLATPQGFQGKVDVRIQMGKGFVISGDQVGTGSVQASILADGARIPIDLPASGSQSITSQLPGDLEIRIGSAAVTVCPVRT